MLHSVPSVRTTSATVFVLLLSSGFPPLGCFVLLVMQTVTLRQGARHLKGTYKDEFLTYIFGIFRAHMGPARALEEREKFKKTRPFVK